MPYNSSWKIWHIDLKVMFWLQIVHASLGVELNGLDRLDGLLFTMRHEPGIFEWKHFWQLSKVFSMHAEMMQCFRLRRLAYCICLLICFCFRYSLYCSVSRPFGDLNLTWLENLLGGEMPNLQSFIWHVTFTAHQAFGGVHAFFAALRFPERIFKGDPCRQRNSAFVCSMEQKCPRAHSIL